jgi:hypothetical protein
MGELSFTWQMAFSWDVTPTSPIAVNIDLLVATASHIPEYSIVHNKKKLPGSIPRHYQIFRQKKKKESKQESSGSGTGFTQPREYN